MELREQLDSPVKMVSQEWKVFPEEKFPVQAENPVPLDVQEDQAVTDFPETLDKRERLVRKELALLVLLACLVMKV